MMQPESNTDLPLRRTLGSCGIEVPALGVGCWAIGGPDTNLGLPMGWGPIDDGQAFAGLGRAYALGARLFGTADVYGHGRSERLLGQLVEQVNRNSLGALVEGGLLPRYRAARLPPRPHAAATGADSG